MTKILVEPRRPIENWQHELDAWITEVEAILGQVAKIMSHRIRTPRTVGESLLASLVGDHR